MRVKVNLQNIIDYGLDVITGNSRQDLLDAAAKAEALDKELFVTIPDAVGGTNDAPIERNTFEHFGPDLPEPEGYTHSQDAVDLTREPEVWCPKIEPHEPHQYTIIEGGIVFAGGLCKGEGRK